MVTLPLYHISAQQGDLDNPLHFFVVAGSSLWQICSTKMRGVCFIRPRNIISGSYEHHYMIVVNIVSRTATRVTSCVREDASRQSLSESLARSIERVNLTCLSGLMAAVGRL